MRELRDHIESIGDVLVTAPDGTQIPAGSAGRHPVCARAPGDQERGHVHVGYVLFDKKPGYAETDVVEEAREYLLGLIDTGDLVLACRGQFRVYRQLRERCSRRPEAGRDSAAGLVDHLHHPVPSVQVPVHQPPGFFGGGRGLGRRVHHDLALRPPWFLDFSIFGTSMRDLFQVQPINLSVAVWVGFLALFGIASDDGVCDGDPLEQYRFRRVVPVRWRPCAGRSSKAVCGGCGRA